MYKRSLQCSVKLITQLSMSSQQGQNQGRARGNILKKPCSYWKFIPLFTLPPLAILVFYIVAPPRHIFWFCHCIPGGWFESWKDGGGKGELLYDG